nr:occlusion-derived virus envelope protein ODV-E56 [Spodoptera litura nucleopolyhedrovirus]
MSFFSNLRRVNKPYPNQISFAADNVTLAASTPNGFQHVFSAPSTRPIANSNSVTPGYNLSNNRFVSTAEINSALRNSDTNSIRGIFGNLNNTQLNGMTQMRRLDNVADPTIFNKRTRQQQVRNNFPDSATRTPEGIQNFMNNQPRLYNYLDNLKKAGHVGLYGFGIWLVFKAGSLISDVRDALNSTGGSFYVTGYQNGDSADRCFLMYRSCGVPAIDIPADAICTSDPLIQQQSTLQNLCNNYNQEAEGSVCRASDPNADPASLQYVDISDLIVNTTITCIEPYDLADLIGDLGLDWLLNENGLVGKSKNSSKSIGEALVPLFIAIGVILFIVFIGFMIYKRVTAPSVRIEGGGGGGGGGGAGVGVQNIR